MTETAPFGDFSMISCKDKHHESSSIYFKYPIGSFKHEHSYGGDSRGVKGGRKLNCIKRKSSDSPLFISNMAFQKDILRDASWHTLHRRQIPFRALHRQHCTIFLQHTFQLLQKNAKVFFLDKRNWSSDFARFPASSYRYAEQLHHRQYHMGRNRIVPKP